MKLKSIDSGGIVPKNFPIMQRPTPLLDLLKGRPTIILQEPLIRRVKTPLGMHAQLPPGVTREEAKEVVKSAWGRKLAEGIADRAGMTGPERERFIENWSDVVSEGLLRGV
jgi:hypothetical protein